MNIGRWYIQKFSDQDLYFFPLAEQKNGGFSGIQIAVDHRRPRASPKATKSSVRSGPRGTAAHFSVLWRPATEVPDRVMQALIDREPSLRTAVTNALPQLKTGRDPAIRRRSVKRKTTKSTRPLLKGKWAKDPVGLFVTLQYQGRTLLGQVRDVRGKKLIIRHFNGEPWPIEPVIGINSVRVIPRTYENGED